MPNPRQIPCLLIGFACLMGPAPATAQSIDNRPVYYTMLQVLEDAFQDYGAALEAEIHDRLAALDEGFRARGEQLEGEIAGLEAERTAKENEFNARREALNRRIVAINEAIALRDGRLSEDRRLEAAHAGDYSGHPRILELKEQVAGELATIESERNRYLERAAELERARNRLNEQISDYVAAGHPLAQEIESLSEDWQRFATSERDKLKAQAEAYATQYAAFNNWLEAENGMLERAREVVQSALDQDRDQRSLHESYQETVRSLIEEYNSLVSAYNQGEGDAQMRATRKARIEALEAQIADQEAALARARAAVIESTSEAQERNRHFRSIYARHLEEKRDREERLSRAKAELNATRAAVESAVDARRRKIDTQIMGLEKDISVELRDARRALEKASAQATAEFGRGHEGFDQATKRVLEANDISLLYTSDGAPRYDLSRPHTAAVYTAVARAAARRREIDAVVAALVASDSRKRADATTSSSPTTLEQDRASVAAERQRLLEAHAAYATEYQNRAAELERHRQAFETVRRDRRRKLIDVYAARADATSNEFLAVQKTLVAAVKGTVDEESGPDRTDALLAVLRTRAAAVEDELREDLRAPDALLRRLRDLVPAQSGARTPPLWQDVGTRPVAGVRELEGAEKEALVRAWLDRLREHDGLADFERDLAGHPAVTDAPAYTGTLFIAGLLTHATIVEQRLAGGETGVEVVILGQAYRLGQDGFLTRAPPRA